MTSGCLVCSSYSSVLADVFASASIKITVAVLAQFCNEVPAIIQYGTGAIRFNVNNFPLVVSALHTKLKACCWLAFPDNIDSDYGLITTASETGFVIA